MVLEHSTLINALNYRIINTLAIMSLYAFCMLSGLRLYARCMLSVSFPAVGYKLAGS